MDLDSRRVVTSRTGVVSGSVWESRMKVDQVRGGIKVFNGDDNPHEIGENSTASGNTEILQVYKRMRPKQGLVGNSGKRKTWKTENSDVADKNPIQIARQKSELTKNLNEQCKELSVSVDGIKKSPIKIAKGRSELSKNLDEQCKESCVSADGIKKSPIQARKTRSEVNRELNLSVDGREKSPSFRTRSMDGMERNSVQVKFESKKASSESSDGNESNAEPRKVKSETNKALDESFNGNGSNSIQLTKPKSVSNKVLDESSGDLSSLADTTGRKSVELGQAKFESNDLVDESRKVLEVSTPGIKKSPAGTHVKIRSDGENCKEFGECEEKVVTSNSGNASQVKSPPKLLLTYEDDEEYWDEETGDEVVFEVEAEKKSFDVSSIREQKAKKVVIEEKKIHQSNVKSVPISPIVKKQLPPVVSNPRIIVPNRTKTKPNEFQRAPKTHSKLQSLVDLVMWRDVSKSAFIFGVGTFIIISSSYTTDINISLITILSYLGLVYLAAIFLFRSIICRGAVNEDDTSQEHVVGEEEAAWLLKLILPYINEFLLKLRALFSGDPATTMKLAVLLFVLARCGSSITIWKMAKLGFFGVFTVPKICSSYSSQLTAFGTFWIQRFKDAWESCSHKKGVGFFIFMVVWNLSSVVARIWAVFMLFVAFRYYQQQYSLMMKDHQEDWIEEEDDAATAREGSVEGNRRQGRHRGPTISKQKQKKGS